MKNKNKTIIESNKGSISKKIGQCKKSKFIKFFIVILVCVFGFFGVNAVVNADMIWDSAENTSNWQMKSHFNWDIFYYASDLGTTSVVGGNDTFAFDFDTYNDFYEYRDAWVMSNGFLNDFTYVVNRFISLSPTLSNDNLLVYRTEINDLNYADYFIFEKNDFFMRLNDLGSWRVPYVEFLQTSSTFSFEMHGFIVDKNGNSNEIVLRTDTRDVPQGTLVSFYPTKIELFGDRDISEIYSNNAIMYISNFRVLIDFPDNHTMDFCEYYYSIQSVEDYNIRYGTIFTDYINLTTDFNVGDFLLDSVNSFLQFEILPNFTLFNLFVLIVAIPLLIWVLKLILGG